MISTTGPLRAGGGACSATSSGLRSGPVWARLASTTTACVPTSKCSPCRGLGLRRSTFTRHAPAPNPKHTPQNLTMSPNMPRP